MIAAEIAADAAAEVRFSRLLEKYPHVAMRSPEDDPPEVQAAHAEANWEALQRERRCEEAAEGRWIIEEMDQ